MVLGDGLEWCGPMLISASLLLFVKCTTTIAFEVVSAARTDITGSGLVFNARNTTAHATKQLIIIIGASQLRAGLIVSLPR